MELSTYTIDSTRFHNAIYKAGKLLKPALLNIRSIHKWSLKSDMVKKTNGDLTATVSMIAMRHQMSMRYAIPTKCENIGVTESLTIQMWENNYLHEVCCFQKIPLTGRLMLMVMWGVIWFKIKPDDEYRCCCSPQD